MMGDDMHRVLFLRLLTRAMDRAFQAAGAVNRDYSEMEMTVYLDAENSDVEEADWYAMGATTIVVRLVHPGAPVADEPTFVRFHADETEATMESYLRVIARTLARRVEDYRAAARDVLRRSSTGERAASEAGEGP